MGCAGGKMDRKCRKSNIYREYNLLLQKLSLLMFQCESYRKAEEPQGCGLFQRPINWVASLSQAKQLFEDDGFIVAAFVLSSLGMLVSGIIIRSGVATVSRSKGLGHPRCQSQRTRRDTGCMFEISKVRIQNCWVLCFFNVQTVRWMAESRIP